MKIDVGIFSGQASIPLVLLAMSAQTASYSLLLFASQTMDANPVQQQASD